MLRSLFPSDPRRTGHEPDYRFSFANERTFLAWIRTSLALTAGGLGVVQLLPPFAGRDLLGGLLIVLGFLTAATSYRRWASNERALRSDAPLPASRLPRILAAGVALVGLAAAFFLLIDRIR
ncbi:MAG TPA: DUF202 domain-containing protein [Acidimicrobiia bacterium]|jgi:putative membrane protein|nr:DUF202 domain-containing protein [Acidimicrobiia bacterium]